MNDRELAKLLDSIGPDDGDDAALDDVWARLTLGELDEDEANGLRVRASSNAAERELLDLYEPLEQDYAARTTERMMALRPDQPAPVVWSREDAEAVVEERPAASTPAASELSLWSRVAAWLRQPIFVGTLVTAAVALLVVGRPAPVQPLPGYDVTVLTADKVVRSDAETSQGSEPVYSDGSLMRVTLTPETRGDRGVDVVVYEQVDEAWRPLSLTVLQDAGGPILLEGVVGEELSATPGVHALRAVLVAAGQPAPAPDDAAESAEAVVLSWSYRVPSGE